jgi:bacillithiol system protein YtxJ
MNWKHLNSLTDLDEAITSSNHSLVILFKHSTRCSISLMAQKMLVMGWDESLDGVEAYHLDLLNHRDVSAAIADKLNITHQSPQLLVLKKGEVIEVANHSDISADIVKKQLNS